MKQLREHIGSEPGIQAVERLEAIYLGLREILVAADVQMAPDLDGKEVAGTLARIRADAERDIPVIARLYLTPVPPCQATAACA